MTWLWVWFVALSHAVDQLSVREAQAMANALAPEVERRTGRTFVQRPTVAIQTRAGLRQILLQPSLAAQFEARVGLRDALPTRPSEASVTRVDYLVTHALAVYAARDETIYLIKEAFERMSRSLAVGGDTMRPALRCVLVHELVHALQHQYGGDEAADADHARGLLALREGQATAVASDYCGEVEGETIAGLMDAVTDPQLEASLDPDGEPAVYAWGRRLVRAIAAENLVWPAQLADPPAWSDVVRAVRPSLLPHWRTGRLLEVALETLESGPLESAGSRPAPPHGMLPTLIDRRPEEMARADGGFVVESSSDQRTMLLAAYLFEDEGAAEAIVVDRDAAVGRWRNRGELMVYDKAEGQLLRKPKVQTPPTDDPRVHRALAITTKTEGSGPYLEVWIATERRLVLFVSAGKALRLRDVTTVARQLLNRMTATPGDAVALGAMSDWLDGVKAVDPEAIRFPSPDYRYEQATRRVTS
ncbi:MAG: hypothetical protein AAF211_09970, partial [Myxococcota bacterium]